MNTIRKYTINDYIMLCDWWSLSKEPMPPIDLLPEETWILENKDGIPWVCLSLMTFPVPCMAWSMGLVSNPELKEGRKEAVQELWDFIADKAKYLGYKNLFCIAPNEALENRYKEIGFMPTLKNVTLMIKSL